MDLNKHEPHFRAWESEMRDGEPPQWSLKLGRVLGALILIAVTMALNAMIVWGVTAILHG